MKESVFYIMCVLLISEDKSKKFDLEQGRLMCNFYVGEAEELYIVNLSECRKKINIKQRILIISFIYVIYFNYI